MSELRVVTRHDGTKYMTYEPAPVSDEIYALRARVEELEAFITKHTLEWNEQRKQLTAEREISKKLREALKSWQGGANAMGWKNHDDIIAERRELLK